MYKNNESDTLEANQEMIDNYHVIKDQDQVNKVYYSQIIKNFESTSVALAAANVWIYKYDIIIISSILIMFLKIYIF